MRMKLAWMLLGFLGLAGASNAADEHWDVYGNARYGYSVCYPPTLKPQGEPENNDGNTFKSADGKLTVQAYANYGIEPKGGPKAIAETFQMSVAEARKRGYKVTYQVLKPALFAFSGVAAAGTPRGRVLYQKTFERPSDKLQVTLAAEYPESMKATADPIVSRMAACLDAGKSPN